MAEFDEFKVSIGTSVEVPMIRKGGFAMNDAVLPSLNVQPGDTISFAPTALPASAEAPAPAPSSGKSK